ncbi:MAG: DUF3768 domain-containing protein [Microvirga sp.]
MGPSIFKSSDTNRVGHGGLTRRRAPVPAPNLNDALRRSFSGGRVVMGAGVAALPSVACPALLAAVRSFDRFETDNDPHGEHDVGTVTLVGYRCCWKIDGYDRDLRCASPDPALTTCVLSVMLAEEC